MARWTVSYSACYVVEANSEEEALAAGIAIHEDMPEGFWQTIAGGVCVVCGVCGVSDVFEGSVCSVCDLARRIAKAQA